MTTPSKRAPSAKRRETRSSTSPAPWLTKLLADRSTQIAPAREKQGQRARRAAAIRELCGSTAAAGDFAIRTAVTDADFAERWAPCWERVATALAAFGDELHLASLVPPTGAGFQVAHGLLVELTRTNDTAAFGPQLALAITGLREEADILGWSDGPLPLRDYFVWLRRTAVARADPSLLKETARNAANEAGVAPSCRSRMSPEQRLARVPKGFYEAIMRRVPEAGQWIHRQALLAAASYAPGGRFGDYLAAMASPVGPLRSHTRKGYRRRT